jgi:competence protein ComEA
MFLKDFIFQNLYYFICGVGLISALMTYLYFYNREVLSFSGTIQNKGENSQTILGSSLEEKDDVVIVDLSGAIERPGIYSLSPGDRLADLISLSGGVTNEVSQKWLSRSLNLSMVLRDQQKIYIPFEWEIAPEAPDYEIKELVRKDPPVTTSVVDSSGSNSTGKKDDTSPDSSDKKGNENTSGGATDASGDLINLNTATKKELIELPRVGEVTAGKIIDNRPYTNLQDVGEKTDIYDSVLEEIKDLVTF